MVSSDDRKTIISVSAEGTTEFEFDFYIGDEADLRVYYTDTDSQTTLLTKGSDYTVTDTDADEYADGGTVTITNPAAGYDDGTVTIVGATEKSQEVDFVENQATPKSVYEASLDKLTMMVQEIAEQGSRALLFPLAELGSEEEIPLADARANNTLAFDENGKPIAASVTDAIVSTFAQTVVNKDDAAAMLTQLGFSAFVQTILNDADAEAVLATLGLTVSAFIKTLLDDAGSAEARTTLDVYSKAEVDQDFYDKQEIDDADPLLLKIARSTIIPSMRVSGAFTGRRWAAIEWSPELELFCIVGFTGTGDRVATSPDGVSWDDRTSAKDVQWYGVAWSADLTLFCAVSTSSSEAMTSPDGITWTLRTTQVDSRKIIWVSTLGLFVALSSGGTSGSVQTSPDGINWTQRTTPAQTWKDLVWSEELGLIVAVGNSGTDRIMTSPDGINWTLRTYANAMEAVAWSPELSMFVATAGFSNDTAYSYDGVNWSTGSQAPTFVPSEAVEWISELGLFMDVGQTNCAISVDGLNWANAPLPADTNNPFPQGVAYSPKWHNIVMACMNSNDGYVIYQFPVI